MATTPDELWALILSCAAAEHPCVELKLNNSSPPEIGRNISAMANAAFYYGSVEGVVIWGVSDETKSPAGTTFRPAQEKQGNQDLELWLHTRLTPPHEFSFEAVDLDMKPIVILRVPAARHAPIAWDNERFFRINNSTTSLKGRTAIEQSLWNKFHDSPLEDRPAGQRIDAAGVAKLLDLQAAARVFAIPTGDDAVALERLEQAGVVRDAGASLYDIPVFGALAFARSLERFGLERKAARVIQYAGERKTDPVTLEQPGSIGYAVVFQKLVEYVNERLPKREEIGASVRRVVPVFPPRAVRELIANALIHQDLSVAGAGPMIEIFAGRIELTNPGASLVEPDRIIDAAAQSRNDRLARLMRTLGFCEERGFGMDHVVQAAEDAQLPAPHFERGSDFTRVTLFAPRPLSAMTHAERVRACYQHAVLQWVGQSAMTNPTLRKRFGIPATKKEKASRIIQETMKEGLIKPRDPASGSRRFAAYVPYFAP